MSASAKQNDTPRTAMTVQDWMRSLIATTPAYSLTSPLKSDDWRDQSVRAMRLALDELTAARAEAEALRKALRLIAEDANLSVIAQERVGNKDSAKAWTVMRDRAIDAARSTEGKK